MCGFSAVISASDLNNIDTYYKKMEKCIDEISHRGPDDRTFLKEQNCLFGHARLSILDINKGNQPFKDDNYILVYNGEIYNFKNLRKKLGLKYNQTFKTDCDTEVLFHGLRLMGTDFLKYLDGMFSFVFYDRKKNTVLAARDISGEKPFFYNYSEGIFKAGSEIKAIKSFVKATVDKKAVKDFFRLQYIPAPFTIYSEIKKLPQGCFLRLDLKKHTVEIKKFHKIKILKSKKNYNISDFIKIFNFSVKKRLTSDVEVGAFLSGGIDSTLVVREMRDIMKNKKFHTFSIGFNEKEFDESNYSYEVSRKYNTIHHHYYFSVKDVCDNLEIISHFDEPFGDSSAMPVMFLSKKISEYVKVVLSGDGADELFGGYHRYRVFHYFYLLKLIPDFLKKIIVFLTSESAIPLLRRVNRILKYNKVEELYADLMGNFNSEEIANLFRKTQMESININHENRIIQKNIVRCNGDILDRIMYSDFYTYLPYDILTKVDMMTMKSGVESRAPFLSKKIIKFAFDLPVSFKKNKKILKNMLKSEFDDKFIYRSKQGFAIPVDRWFREELGNVLKKLLLENKEWKKYLNSDYIDFLFNEHINFKKSNGRKLWQIMVFVLWAENEKSELNI